MIEVQQHRVIIGTFHQIGRKVPKVHPSMTSHRGEMRNIMDLKIMLIPIISLLLSTMAPEITYKNNSTMNIFQKPGRAKNVNCRPRNFDLKCRENIWSRLGIGSCEMYHYTAISVQCNTVQYITGGQYTTVQYKSHGSTYRYQTAGRAGHNGDTQSFQQGGVRSEVTVCSSLQYSTGPLQRQVCSTLHSFTVQTNEQYRSNCRNCNVATNVQQIWGCHSIHKHEVHRRSTGVSNAAAGYCTVQYSAVLYNTVHQRGVVQYSTVQYYNKCNNEYNTISEYKKYSTVGVCDPVKILKKQNQEKNLKKQNQKKKYLKNEKNTKKVSENQENTKKVSYNPKKQINKNPKNEAKSTQKNEYNKKHKKNIKVVKHKKSKKRKNTEKSSKYKQKKKQKNTKKSKKSKSTKKLKNLKKPTKTKNKKQNVSFFLARKMRNKKVKATNGNISKTLNIIHWNLGSRYWGNKTEEIQILVDEMKPDLVFISEANLFSGLSEHERIILGYKLVITRSMEYMGYSRLVLLVREGLDIKIQESLMEAQIASIWVKISGRGLQTTMIGGIYREHKLLLQGLENNTNDDDLQTQRWNKFLNQWKQATAMSSQCHVIGDVNLDHFRWNDPTQAHEQMVQATKEEIETLNYTQIIEGATRAWPDTADSLIDHCWTNSPDKIISKRNIVRAVGDHNVLQVVIKLKGTLQTTQEIRKRIWKNLNLERMRMKTENINWQEFQEIENIDVANHWLETKLNDVLNSEAPWSTIQPRKGFRKWVTEDTKTLMEKRDSLGEKARMDQTNESWKNYREVRNLCTKKVKENKQEHFKTKYKDCEVRKDIKGTYELLKQQAGWKTVSTPTMFIKDGKQMTSPQQMADEQMKFFHEKTQKLINELPPPQYDPLEILDKAIEKWGAAGNRSKFCIQEVSEMEVLKSMKELGNTTSSGMDGLDAVFLKAVATTVYRPITKLVNMSIRQKIFASRWKIAKILPIHKGKGKPIDSPSSYRPISLLPVISKIVERTIQKQMTNFMITSKQMSTNQHAYRINHSTTSALAQLTDQLYEATDQNLISCLLAVDQSSAFDCVSHQTLLKKLLKYNFDTDTVKWFNSYLSHRTQCVQIGSKLSHMKPVQNGVPQGSVLGPMLYSIYINELPAIMKNKYDCQHTAHNSEYLFGKNCPQCGNIICFADDSTLIFSSNSRILNQMKLVEGLDIIGNFLTANQLSINRTKTTISEIMIGQKRARTPGHPPTLSEFESDGTEKIIKAQSETRLLGANIQDNMSWKAHLDTGEEAMLPEARKKLGILKHLGKQAPKHSRKILADGLVLSKIRYLTPLWGGTSEKNLNAVQTLINNTARFVTGWGRRTSTMDLMTECQWLTARELVLQNSLLLMWKIVRLDSPSSIKEKIQLVDEGKLSTSVPRLLHTSQGFRWRSVIEWNKLPTTLREQLSLPTFKKELGKWILSKREKTG